MKTKRFLIAVLTAALVTAFIIGCNVQPDDTGLEIVKVNDAKDQPAPSGKIKVRLSLEDTGSNARTVYPTGTGAYANASAFPFFLLKVYKGSTDVTPTSGTLSTFFTHDAFATETLTLNTSGVYSFAIIACNLNKDNYLAFGHQTQEIDTDDDNNDGGLPDAVTSVTITLHEIVGNVPDVFGGDYDGTGKFAWNLDVSTFEYDTATLTLTKTKDSSHPSGFNPLDLTSSSSSTGETIDPGYYMMVITLTKTGYQTAYVREIVHIYSGFTSTYAMALPALRSLSYPITLNYTGGATVDATHPATKTATHGMTYSAFLSNTVSGLVDITSPAHSFPNDSYFGGWFLDSGLAPVDALVLTDYIIKQVTLYAKWLNYPTPDELLFDIDITSPQVYSGAPATAADISPKTNDHTTSQGAITQHYVGTGGYNATTAPTNAGTYTVTFDVAADPGYWRAATGLPAGTLVINNATPVAGDYDIANNDDDIGPQAWGSVVAVTVEPQAGKSSGARTIYYTGVYPTDYTKSSVLPEDPGTYAVTFDVAAVANWNSAEDLSAGTLTITPSTQYFNIGLHWTAQATAPIISNDSEVSYNPSDKTLTIYINITNYSSNGFVWNVDFSEDPLNSSNHLLSDTLILDLTNADDRNWLLNTPPSERCFTVIIDNLYTFKITLD